MAWYQLEYNLISAMLRDVVVVGNTRQRSMPLAMLNIRKEFPLLIFLAMHAIEPDPLVRILRYHFDFLRI